MKTKKRKIINKVCPHKWKLTNSLYFHLCGHFWFFFLENLLVTPWFSKFLSKNLEFLPKKILYPQIFFFFQFLIFFSQKSGYPHFFFIFLMIFFQPQFFTMFLSFFFSTTFLPTISFVFNENLQKKAGIFFVYNFNIRYISSTNSRTDYQERNN